MELHDYLTALRRHWRTWVGLTIVGLLVAVVTIQLSPQVYRATAGVFVASTLEGTSGSQFVNQRVRSYPEIALSLAVLAPVIEDLDLDVSLSELRAAVTATNPVDTSQVDISVTSGSAEWAAEVANAVADEFGQTVEVLEAPVEGQPPVDLTVTDPATVPASPVSPDPLLLLTLGLVVGLFLGLALAIVRSRMSTALYTEDDVREAWGDNGAQLTVHAPRAGRGGRRNADTLTAALIRQLETLAEQRPVRLLAVSPTTGREAELTRLLAKVATELSARGVPAILLGGQDELDATSHRAPIHLQVAAPVVALRDWRRMAAGHDGLLVVAEAGRVTAGQLRELQAMTSAVELEPVALVLVPDWRPPVRTAEITRSAGRGIDAARLRIQPGVGSASGKESAPVR